MRLSASLAGRPSLRVSVSLPSDSRRAAMPAEICGFSRRDRIFFRTAGSWTAGAPFLTVIWLARSSRPYSAPWRRTMSSHVRSRNWKGPVAVLLRLRALVSSPLSCVAWASSVWKLLPDRPETDPMAATTSDEAADRVLDGVVVSDAATAFPPVLVGTGGLYPGIGAPAAVGSDGVRDMVQPC